MWIVAKVKPNSEKIFIQELKNKIGAKANIYLPKILLSNNYKKKSYYKNILGNYVLCKSDSFKNVNILKKLTFTKGLNYFLIGSDKDSNEINKFVNLCRKNENENGFISNSFFFDKIKKHSKIVTGPFKNILLDIIKIKNKKLIGITGDIKFVINNKCKNYCYPV